MTANTYGRQVVVPLTNKSGGGVVAGDVVIVDTSNNDAFTTTTSANFTGGVGVAQETIASNAAGRVLLSGYAALINVNASVTRGHFGATYTVAKQATDAGASRGAGTFCQFLTGGTTPDAIVYPVDLLGSSLTNPMTTAGDIIVADTGGTPLRLAKGSDSTVLTVSASTHLPVWSAPSAGGASTSDHFVTTQAESDLSAETARPELGDYNTGTPTAIDFSSPATGTGASTVSSPPWNLHGKWTTSGSINYIDVASSIGTADFDVRARITHVENAGTTLAGDSFGGFALTDSSRTTGTMLFVYTSQRHWTANNTPLWQGRTGNTASGNIYYNARMPIIVRIRRTGTTYTYEISTSEGALWTYLTSGTSSLNIAKIGFWFDCNSGTSELHLIADWIRSYA